MGNNELSDFNHLIDYMSFICNEITRINKDIEQTDYIIREYDLYKIGWQSAARWPEVKKLIDSKFRGNIDIVTLYNKNYKILNKASRECLQTTREQIKKISDSLYSSNNNIIHNEFYKMSFSKMITSLHKLNESDDK